ncbi:MAG: CarD family transcriptional regulator [Myxococcota bacterium]
MSDLSLAIGDRVVYPNQGLCTVTDIKTEEIAGQRLTFVSLVFSETGAKVKVPKEKLAKNGVRRVSTSDDVKKVFEFLKSDSERASLDWKKRARDNTARLSEGGLVGLAEVVKGLQVLSELRPLPPKERGQYNDARHLFVEELAAALGISEADAEDSLDVLLFPPGKERPKRSIEEFQGLGEDDELGLGEDLLGLDGESSESEGEGESAEAGEGEEGEAGDEEGKKKAPKGKPEPKPAKEAKAPPKGKKSVVSDLEVTEPLATALPALPLPKKRGRPPKPKPPEPAEPQPPKKRGRPPKAKPPEAAHPPPKGKAKGKGK